MLPARDLRTARPTPAGDLRSRSGQDRRRKSKRTIHGNSRLRLALLVASCSMPLAGNVSPAIADQPNAPLRLVGGSVQVNPFVDLPEQTYGGIRQASDQRFSEIRLKTIDGAVGLLPVQGEQPKNAQLTVEPVGPPAVRLNPHVHLPAGDRTSTSSQPTTNNEPTAAKQSSRVEIARTSHGLLGEQAGSASVEQAAGPSEAAELSGEAVTFQFSDHVVPAHSSDPIDEGKSEVAADGRAVSNKATKQPVARTSSDSSNLDDRHADGSQARRAPILLVEPKAFQGDNVSELQAPVLNPQRQQNSFEEEAERPVEPSLDDSSDDVDQDVLAGESLDQSNEDSPQGLLPELPAPLPESNSETDLTIVQPREVRPDPADAKEASPSRYPNRHRPAVAIAAPPMRITGFGQEDGKQTPIAVAVPRPRGLFHTAAHRTSDISKEDGTEHLGELPLPPLDVRPSELPPSELPPSSGPPSSGPPSSGPPSAVSPSSGSPSAETDRADRAGDNEVLDVGLPLQIEQPRPIEAAKPIPEPVHPSIDFDPSEIGVENRRQLPLAEVLSINVSAPIDNIELFHEQSGEVCRVVGSTTRSVRLLGCQPGTAYLVVTVPNGTLDEPSEQRFAIEVVPPPTVAEEKLRAEESLLKLIDQQFPQARVDIRSDSERVVVTGTCRSNAEATQIIRMIRKSFLVAVVDRLIIR